MLVADSVAITVPPAHVVDAFGVVATTRPVGSVSVNAAAVKATAFGLSIRTTSEAEVPGIQSITANTFMDDQR